VLRFTEPTSHLVKRENRMSQNESTNKPITQEFEWGVRYENPDGNSVEVWGYKEDPRTNGLISKENEIEMDWEYGEYLHMPVLAVGKRPYVPGTWETI
jgi:hypothetical protein